MRGPGPSCSTVARIAFRGHVGANRFRFDGRIAGRPLEPGTYLLTPRLRGRHEDLGRAFVTIVAPDSPRLPRVLPVCEEARLARTFLAGEEGVGPPQARPVSTVVPASPSPSAPTDGAIDGGIRGEESPPFVVPPRWPALDNALELPVVLGLAVLGLLAVSLLGIAVEVFRHLRSRQV